jgi:hypothetical protein
MNATKVQTWKLFTLTKTDYRGKLTYVEADKMIQTLEADKLDIVAKWRKLWADAKEAGNQALLACVPIPMVVQQHSNMMDDNSKVTKEWVVEDGMCGFAWVTLPYKGTNIKFINAIKKFEPDRLTKAYGGGYSYWIHEGNQSYTKKMKYAQAMATALNNGGIKAYSGSRLD